MTVKDLWGELPTQDLVRNPYTILREQAALLGEKTENLLEGRVRRTGYSSGFMLFLDIVAPTLDNYSYTVLIVTHGIELYPVRMKAEGYTTEAELKEYKGEKQFVEALSEILISNQIRKVIAGLLSYVKETE